MKIIGSDMPAWLSCENAQTHLIWVKMWKYPLLSLCISVLTICTDFIYLEAIDVRIDICKNISLCTILINSICMLPSWRCQLLSSLHCISYTVGKNPRLWQISDSQQMVYKLIAETPPSSAVPANQRAP